jgi:hypothetical protein
MIMMITVGLSLFPCILQLSMYNRLEKLFDVHYQENELS